MAPRAQQGDRARGFSVERFEISLGAEAACRRETVAAPAFPLGKREKGMKFLAAAAESHRDLVFHEASGVGLPWRRSLLLPWCANCADRT